MSNDGTWQPPQPGGTPPPPPPHVDPVPARPAPPLASATSLAPPPGWERGPEAPLVPPTAGDDGSGSKGRLVAIVGGVLVLVAAGIFAITRLGGGGSSGGADSPEEAGQAVLDALGEEDVLGMIDVLLPGERDAMRGPASDLAEELTRIEVLSDDATLEDISGVDLTFSDTSVEATATNVEDIVDLHLRGDVSVSVDGGSLPIGDLLYDRVPDVDPATATVETTEPTAFDVPLAAVREDGRWYVSAFYSIAEVARAEAGLDIPAEGIVPTGGDSPEDAFDALLDGVEALDLRAMVASLNPNEFAALQRYGPAFLDDAQRELDASGVELTLDEADYEVQGDGDRRSITLSHLSGAITAEGETVPFELEGGCFRATSPDGLETIDSCEMQGATAEEVLGTDAELVADLMTTVENAMADYQNPGVIVEQVDGTWYVSPMATGAEQVLAVLRALERDEIDAIADEATELIEVVAGDLTGTALDIPGEILEGTGTDSGSGSSTETLPGVTPEPVVPDETIEEGAGVPTTLPDVAAGNELAGDECYAAETAIDAAACFEALVATGEIAPSAVPIYLRAPQCGLADAYWVGELFTMTDADFTAAIATAAPCYQALVTDGTLDEFDLPLELSDPECLEGRNWYAANDDDAYFERITECAYG